MTRKQIEDARDRLLYLSDELHKVQVPWVGPLIKQSASLAYKAAKLLGLRLDTMVDR